MEIDRIKEILTNVKSGKMGIESAMDKLKKLPFEDIGYAMVDQHRNIRNGSPEIIYSEGKNSEQIKGIIGKLIKNNNNIIASRASEEVYNTIKEITNDCIYYKLARIVVVNERKKIINSKPIAIIAAGTSDIPVAEEAAITAETMGNKVKRIYDVGVAGIHRLFSKMEEINEASVIIVVAGMEGALASVVGGLVDKPVIALPTSIGYGASFGGLAALLAMLNSCASGITVVNIDNGLGAGFSAATINNLVG